jgi:hypothetical protein
VAWIVALLALASGVIAWWTLERRLVRPVAA